MNKVFAVLLIASLMAASLPVQGIVKFAVFGVAGLSAGFCAASAWNEE